LPARKIVDRSYLYFIHRIIFLSWFSGITWVLIWIYVFLQANNLLD
jgi:hypothetical protein